jgi:hypothetical protein
LKTAEKLIDQGYFEEYTTADAVKYIKDSLKKII